MVENLRCCKEECVGSIVWAVFGGLLRILVQLEFNEICGGWKSAHEILASQEK
jgi:hypothetical protein